MLSLILSGLRQKCSNLTRLVEANGLPIFCCQFQFSLGAQLLGPGEEAIADLGEFGGEFGWGEPGEDTGGLIGAFFVVEENLGEREPDAGGWIGGRLQVFDQRGDGFGPQLVGME